MRPLKSELCKNYTDYFIEFSRKFSIFASDFVLILHKKAKNINRVSCEQLTRSFLRTGRPINLLDILRFQYVKVDSQGGGSQGLDWWVHG